jgi:polyisoprenoid-binding protein YceI
MSRLARGAALAVALVLLTLPAIAGTWNIDSAHSSVQFAVRHMMVSTVRGEFTKVSGSVDLDEADISKSRIEATIDATTINTREPKRDAHLKTPDFFDVANNPTITFRSKSVEKAGAGFRVTGDLTLRGVTKEVVLDVDPLSPQVKDPGGNARTGTTARTKINRKDFGVSWNRALDAGGVVVSDDVAITIDVELLQRKQQ